MNSESLEVTEWNSTLKYSFIFIGFILLCHWGSNIVLESSIEPSHTESYVFLFINLFLLIHLPMCIFWDSVSNTGWIQNHYTAEDYLDLSIFFTFRILVLMEYVTSPGLSGAGHRNQGLFHVGQALCQLSHTLAPVPCVGIKQINPEIKRFLGMMVEEDIVLTC